jgi:phospholipid/cholesterol/gamma-HCH transport system substrate-binding protein
MKKDWIARELTMEMVVGAFIIMILFGLAYFTIILSRETWFSDKHEYEVIFDHVMGLREGDDVVVRGMTVGKVDNLSLGLDGVHVLTKLDTPLRLREKYKITIVSSSILGGVYLSIDEGSETSRELPEGAVFVGESPNDLVADAADLVGAVKDDFLREGGILDNFKTASVNIKDITDRLNKGEGTIGKFLSDDSELYEDLSATIASLKTISGKIEKGEGTIGKLLSKDDKMYENIAASAESFKNISARLEAGKGTLGKLMSEDEDLYNNLNASAASLKKIIARIENGEGTLGKLMSEDEGLYEEIEGIVGEARATVEDYRETAPIVTFTSIFFGAF